MKTLKASTVMDSVTIRDMRVSAFDIPTDAPEADGTLQWNSTTLVLVEIDAGGKTGVGYTYASEATAHFISRALKDLVLKMDVMQNAKITDTLIRHIRNSGNCGIAMMAVSAVDNALWDLKAKILGLPLCSLLGKVRNEMLLYGSGGFTSYNSKQLQQQFEHWSGQGIRCLKMKVGTHPEKDVQRVKTAREAVPDDAEIFVDANGAYAVKEALDKAAAFSTYGVTWFEEPVSSDNRDGLNFIREHAPGFMRIAAGEYGYQLPYFKTMLGAACVDVLQADATRCGGISGFLKAGHLCEAFQIPFSSHCAPSLHLHAAIALPSFYIAEYFHDHVRIESMLFEGIEQPSDGTLKPDMSRPGMGFEFKYQDAARYQL